MSSVYHEAECIARRVSEGARLLFFVSCGRDSSCILELMSKYIDMSRHVYVHYTPYETVLPYQSRHLDYLSRRYKIDIQTRPDPRSIAYKLRGVAEDRDMLLDQHGCSLCVLGYRMDESLQRRGMLKSKTTGIDDKVRECYPLRAWTSRITDAFVKTRRIPLAPEYKYGFRDCRNHRGLKAVLLRQISEEDYLAAVAQDPQIEVDYVRHAHRWDTAHPSEIQDEEDEEG